MKKRLAWSIPVLLLLATILLYGGTVILDPEIHDQEDAAGLAASGRFLQLTHGPTWYETAGPVEGHPVVLVHGFAIDSSIWQKNIPALADAGHRVIRYDQYGRGFSSRPPAVHDIGLFADQLLELLDTLQVARAVDIACVSAGCVIASEFALRHPWRVGRVMMVDPQMRPFGFEQWRRFPLLGDLADMMSLDDLATAVANAYPELSERFEIQRRIKGYRRSLAAIQQAQSGIDPMERYAQLAMVGVPVYLVEGENDRGQERRKEFMEVTRTLAYIEIPGAGHGANFHAAGLANAAILRLLESAPR